MPVCVRRFGCLQRRSLTAREWLPHGQENVVYLCQRSEGLEPEQAANGEKDCPASILSARPLLAAVSVQGGAGLHSSGDVEARWWLHLYVMFSRVTCMRNMLLLRPPPRELLEKGLPPSVREALWMFAEKITDSTRMAASWTRECGMSVPEK